MAYTPSVRTEADGNTTVHDGLTATDVQTPITIADPTDAPILAAVVPDGVTSFAVAAGSYQVSYTWLNEGGRTAPSPEATIAVDGSKAISVTLPALPDGVGESMVFSDNATGLGLQRFSGAYVLTGQPLTVYLTVMDESTWSAQFLPPADNWTGAPSYLHSELDVAGNFFVNSKGQILQDFRVGRSATEWNANPLSVQPAITGALSTVTDAAAKAVLTSIIAVLVNKGSATDSTT